MFFKTEIFYWNANGKPRLPALLPNIYQVSRSILSGITDHSAQDRSNPTLKHGDFLHVALILL